MELTTRLMEPREAKAVQKIAQHAFKGLEALMVPKPKLAVVAVTGEKIVGAIQIKIYNAGGKKVGYYDYAFIDPDYHNQGIGTTLYQAAAAYLWEQGCQALSALVKDDNPGSWHLFLKTGFKRSSLSDLVRQFGMVGALRLYFFTIYGVAIGMDYYIALPSREVSPGDKKSSDTGQMAVYLFLNLLLPLVLFLRSPGNMVLFYLAFLILMAGGILAGYLGTFFSKRDWKFRLCNGGGFVCILITLLGSIFPLTGNWYPVTYEKSESFRRDMGLQALTGWIFILAISFLSMVMEERHLLFRYLNQISSLFLMYRIFAFYPFESYGGGRVFHWNKAVYGGFALISALAIYLS